MALNLGSVPSDATTADIHASLLPLSVSYIDIDEDVQGARTGKVRVRIEAPRYDYWYDHVWLLKIHGPPERSVRISVHVDGRSFKLESDYSIMTSSKRWVQAEVELDLGLLGQGFMHQKRTMMVMDEVDRQDEESAVSFKVNFQHRKIVLFAKRRLEEAPKGTVSVASSRPRSLLVEYKTEIRFAWIKNIWEQDFKGNRVCIVLNIDSPPEYWRKTQNTVNTHGHDHLTWSDREEWVRMASLTMNQRAVRDAAVALKGVFRKSEAVDLGRWCTFRLGLEASNVEKWREVSNWLSDFAVRVKPCPEFCFLQRDDHNMWDCVQISALSQPAAPPSNMHHLSRSLAYEVAYQLEVCISRNILHESTLDVVFLESLAALTPDRATRMLEYVAERGKRVYQPHSIFRDPRAASYWRKTPTESSIDKDKAVYIRKATVTPTTIIYGTPTLEPGNRVLRHFREHHDRFLRVQFTDELLLGRLSGDRNTKRTDECFSRAFRALKNGIRVGGRHFEFLAFGNSQLRENSTYFFAPTELVSCQNIRDWMGDFSSIKTVAKYAARLGQCLSTTRPVPTFGVPTTLQRIHDVNHGKYCYTDGVGKISSWWARVIAGHLKVDQVPSAVQFRMGGCKGILVVWPDVPPGQIVQIRPSQEKFPTLEGANHLEIVRCSETATATLNQQTIILLTTLHVPEGVFLNLLHEELAGLDAVMKSPDRAIDQLMLRVDQNRVTPVIADLVKAGFMTSDEPFVWALLQLWRSWTLKALKEKARISVAKSAFVLGCVDETDTLRGHTERKKDPDIRIGHQVVEDDPSSYPQIFLQVPDIETSAGGFAMLKRNNNHAHKGGEKYKIITGLCLVGRNPSLHPGDLRVVEAVDVPALHHLKDVVVFPRVGDRDLPSMCSGGDLDGDDYFVFWDERLLPPPKFRNYTAMNYDSVREPDVEQVTPRHLISFFVQHMKHDNLPRIAVAHRAFADHLEGGAMNPRCLELAQLHSQAVDYAKTGIPALMHPRLAPKKFPHWMANLSKTKYVSRTALGKIYNKVQIENFEPAFDRPFDRRILAHYPSLDAELLHRARRIKSQYDLALRRAMAQKELDSEFELWTGFAMKRPRVGTDYKSAEDLGRLYRVITSRFRRLCLREVDNARDIAKLGPFVAAMYRVTHEEVQIGLHEYALARGQKEKKRFAPLISFPWLFSHELCAIAKASDLSKDEAEAKKTKETKNTKEKDERRKNYLLTPAELHEMAYTQQNGVPTHHGIPLDLSFFDKPNEDEDDGTMDDPEFQPMWKLPPGKSEDDVLIQLVIPESSEAPEEEEGGDADGDNYDLLMTQFSETVSSMDVREKATTTTTASSVPRVFPWAEIEDDVLSTTSEESLPEAYEEIVIHRDDDDDDNVTAIKDKDKNGKATAKGASTTGPSSHSGTMEAEYDNLPEGLRGRPIDHSALSLEVRPPLHAKEAEGMKPPPPPSTMAVSLEDVEDDADDEADVLANMGNLFGQ